MEGGREGWREREDGRRVGKCGKGGTEREREEKKETKKVVHVRKQ